MNKAPMKFNVLLAVACVTIGSACGSDDLGRSHYEVQEIPMGSSKVRLVREYWGVTDDHTNLHIVTVCDDQKRDTVFSQLGNNLLFYKASHDTLVVYVGRHKGMAPAYASACKSICLKLNAVGNVHPMTLLEEKKYLGQGLLKF